MAELTTSQIEEQMEKHNFIDRGGAQKESCLLYTSDAADE